MKILLVIGLAISMAGCAAAIPFGVGAAVGTAVTQHNNPQPSDIPPRPAR